MFSVYEKKKRKYGKKKEHILSAFPVRGLVAIHSTLVFVEITSCIYTYTKTIVIFNFGEIVASRPGKYSATISKNNG